MLSRKLLSSLPIVSLLLLVAPASSLAINVPAAGDIWVRESAPDTTYASDLISVWATDADNFRLGVVVFDLTAAGITNEIVTGAFLQLHIADNSTATGAIEQSAYMLDTATLPNSDTLTYNDYLANFQATQISMESLGSMSIAADSPAETYYNSAAASAADLTALNSRLAGNGGPGWVAFIFEASTGKRDWSDVESGFAPQLVLSTVPEPSTWALLVVGAVGIGWMRRRKLGQKA